jgi:HlyD family secretion protein
MKPIQIIIPMMVGAVLLACTSKNGQTDASGTFEATEILVSAQAAGTLEEFKVEEGQAVKAGQILGYIDTIQFHLKRNQLLASIEAIRSRLPDVSIQLAALEQQLATAKTERNRVGKLIESHVAPQKQADDFDAQIKILQKQISASRNSLDKTQQGAVKDIEALRAQLEQVEDMLDKSYVRSPIDGIVLVKYTEQGELASQGKILFKVADMRKLKLRVYVTADQLSKLKLGQPIKVNAEFGSKENKTYQGIVSWISDKSEFTPKTIQTRDERANLVYAVNVEVPNDGNLKIGMYGGIYLENR